MERSLKLLESVILVLFLLSIPFDAKIFIGGFGFPISEWTAVFLYGTDILFLLLLFLWKAQTKWSINPVKSDYSLWLFFAVGLISAAFAVNRLLGIYHAFKLLEGIFIYYYIKNRALSILGSKKIFLALFLSGVFQSVIGIFQLFIQKSIGLRLLGESILNPAMQGVAKISLGSEKIIRAYGTTPHPNILGGFLLLAVFCFYLLFLNKDKKYRLWQLLFAYGVVLFGLFGTFSRAALISWLFASLMNVFLVFKFNFWRNFSIYAVPAVKICAVTLAVAVIFSALFSPFIASRFEISSDSQEVELRLWYAQESVRALGRNLFIGAGVGNFTAYLLTNRPGLESWQYQPAHSLYLLVLAETGVVGFILFILFLWNVLKEYIKKTRFYSLQSYAVFTLLCGVLLLGVFDHYLWTLQEGRLIFWSSLGILGWYAGD